MLAQQTAILDDSQTMKVVPYYNVYHSQSPLASRPLSQEQLLSSLGT